MSEAIPLSEELLRLMRTAAKKAIELREAFITPRAMLLALLDDPAIGPALSHVINKEEVLSVEAGENFGAVRVVNQFAGSEDAAMTRYDTLAFKTPDGRASMWLSRDANTIFMEGAQRVEDRYVPKHLALGFATQARNVPGVLTAMRVEPGVLADAIYKL